MSCLQLPLDFQDTPWNWACMICFSRVTPLHLVNPCVMIRQWEIRCLFWQTYDCGTISVKRRFAGRFWSSRLGRSS